MEISYFSTRTEKMQNASGRGSALFKPWTSLGAWVPSLEWILRQLMPLFSETGKVISVGSGVMSFSILLLFT
jgi:hypothetical protein